MPSDAYELGDVTVKYRSDNSLNENSARNKDKMYISPAKAFILAFLAIAVAVGVGLIVHFAGSGRDFECKCTYPTAGPSAGGGVSAALEECKVLAGGGHSEVCKYTKILIYNNVCIECLVLVSRYYNVKLILH